MSGYFLRLALWFLSDGSNDIRTWHRFAVTLRDLGLEGTYASQPLFNHPPLIGWWSVIALRFSEKHILTFAQVFKLPSLVAEIGTGLLLIAVWKRRNKPRVALAAFAAYGLSLSCILISSFHGNTDALYFCLAFAAAYLLEDRRPFWAGLALAAACNIKLIPLLLVLPLASRCSKWSDLWRFLGGTVLGAVPFVWALVTFKAEARSHFVSNIFLYHSNLEYWGIELAVRWAYGPALRLSSFLAREILAAGTWYSVHGGDVMLAMSAGLAAWHVWRIRHDGGPRLDAYKLSGLTFSAFLLFGSGFGVQYVGCIVAPLLASSVWDGAIVSTVTGLFIARVYLHFIISWAPIASEHLPIPRSFSGLAVLAWISIAVASLNIWRRRGAFSSAEDASEREPVGSHAVA